MPLDTATVDRILDEVAELYSAGKFLQAYAKGQALGELKDWPGTKGRLWAGRLASNLGAPRLGAVLQQLAWRADKEDPYARFFYITALLRRRDPLFALKRMEQWGELDGARDNLQADWFALRAYLLAALRDFENADAWFARAEALTPERPWIWVERASILAEEDLHDKALEAAERAFELRPWYRPAVQAKAYALIHLNRDLEALDLLSQAAQRLESGSLVAQVALLQTELGQYADARENYERIAAYFPLMEKRTAQWLAARRSNAAYYCFDFPQAAELARQVDEPFFDKMAERLSANPLEGRRVMLGVGYVRQHHVTCAPATLTALSAFWKRPAEHLNVAEEICYDGTPSHSQRNWAEKNGWIAREFTVTWDSAVALLDRGIPFTLTITFTGLSHLQAIIGYDSRRKTLLIRDPTERMFLEYEVDEFFEREASNGPRGMALVPADRTDLLEGLKLPDDELYDRFHVLHCAIEEHDRLKAQRAYEAMQAIAADHRLTINARNTLARYDSDVVAILQTTEQLLEKYPKDENLQLLRLACLRQLGRRDQRLEILRGICNGEAPDPLFFQELASELLVDAREHDYAEWLIRRTIRKRPDDAESYCVLGEIRWDRHRREEALELYRYAACLEDRQESFAHDYFVASRYLRRTDVALRFLKDRFVRFGHRSSLPARTLSSAYDALHQHAEAQEVLQSALQLHDDDGELRLFTADYYARYGDFARAEQLLTEAKPNCHRTMWLRCAARIAVYRGDLNDALAKWREILTVEPTALDAQDAVARLLYVTEGYGVTLEHMRSAVAQFPNNYVLHQMLIEWLRRSDPAETEAAVRDLLQIQSVDPWARRELAICLCEQGKLAEGLAEAKTAYELEPNSPTVHLIFGLLHRKAGDIVQAKEYFRKAIRLSVDYERAIEELLTTCDSKAERAAELDFVRQELLRQVIFGDAVIAYCECAATTLEPERLLDTLREILAARPDLWQAWSATIDQLLETERVAEALETAKQFVDRFPLLPIVWLDLAKVHHERGEFDEEIAAIQRALDISPGMSYASRALAEAHEHQGDFDKARDVLEQAIARDPANPSNHNFLAEVLWRLRRKDDALKQIQLAIRLAPAENDWGWRMYRAWCQELGRIKEVVELAREFTRTRPNVAAHYLVLASLLDAPDQRDEALAALNRALELDPRSIEAHGRRADLLVAEGKFDEAIAACRPAAFSEGPPLLLRARAAAIEAERGNLPAAIDQMQQVVHDDPEYFYAWAQLCAWYSKTGQEKLCADAAAQLCRLVSSQPDWQAWTGTAHHLIDVGQAEQALALAERAATRFPANPLVWMTLAYVQHIRGDEPAEIAALERAVQIDPHCSDAARFLAETYNRHGDFQRCREVMERAVAHDPHDAINHGYLAEALWNLGERAAALEHIQQAVRLAPGEEWGWNALRSWSHQAGLNDLPVRLARQLTEERPDDVDVWVAKAVMLEEPSQRSEAHAALDKALQLEPRNISAHMHRATLLAADGQHDAAVVACHPPIFEERPPVPLLMHAAEIEANRGNLVAAIAQLQDVVLDEPDFFWAWKRLADWYEETGHLDQYVRAAEHMVRLEPQEPKCWGYLGDAHLRAGKRDVAKGDLQRAIELAPDYPFAANLLLELQIEDGELEAAGKTIDRVAQYMPRGYVAAHRVRLAGRSKDKTAAAQHLRELCQSDASGPEPFYGAIDEMVKAGWDDAIEAVLAEEVARPGANPQLGGVWIEWCASKENWDRCREALEALRGRGEIWLLACASYLHELADAKQEHRLRGVLERYQAELCGDVRTWAAAGAALAALGKPADAVAWLADWRQRQDVLPYMLVALVGALWEVGREDEAAEVGKFAIELPHNDPAKAAHALWLALHAALHGDLKGAAMWLGPMLPEMFNSPFYAALCTLVRVLVAAQLPPSDRGGEISYGQARQTLQAAMAPFAEQLADTKLLRRILCRCFSHLAAHFGRTLTAAWWRLKARWA
jgi:tetratricopeptide (TPR) repeat protein